MLLSKLLSILVYPLSMALWGLLIGLILLLSRRRRSGAVLIGFGTAVLIAGASPLVAATLYRGLERQFMPVALERIDTADAIVVLGGAVGAPLPPRLYVDLHGGSDRVLHAARLYRAGKAPLLIVSGGNVFPESRVGPEADYIAELLRQWGVARDAIVIEGASRNTRENALETRKILSGRGKRTVLLVTSALHMPRALATFRTAGVDASPAPTDFRLVDSDRPQVFAWLPSAGALEATTAAMHEWLGLAYYRWKGWIE
jgi:uncharacterized SAM-binding protein YcdF (DUF218 family)